MSTDDKATEPNCDLLGIRGYAPNPPATFPLLMHVFSPNWSASTAASRRLSDDIHVHPSLGRYLPPLTGFQRSSDTRSCIGRSSCARSQRSRASSPRGWQAGVGSRRLSVHTVTARLEEWAWSGSPPRASQPGVLWLPQCTRSAPGTSLHHSEEIMEQHCRDETVGSQCISTWLACADATQLLRRLQWVGTNTCWRPLSMLYQKK